MIMRKFIILIALLPIMCYAQFEASMFSTNNQKLIEQAVQSGFVIVEQTYQLEDSTTHQRFGRYGNEIFGKARSLGVRVGNDVIVNKEILSPWDKDENFERYRNTHIPVVASTSIIELNDTIKKDIIMSTDSLLCVTESIISVPDSFLLKGFEIGVYDRPLEGWFVWITSDKAISEWGGTSLNLSIYKKTVEFVPDKNKYEIDAPQTSNHLWGGVFLIPEQTRIGQLTFKLGGIAVKTDNGWTLETILPSVENVIPQIDELTPLGDQSTKTKKKKKR